ncbi:MAG: diadenylate cyclase CdaA [Gemmatimonadota bacterium]|nr:diadenylate cyclase CdaA [Gemmatimonadota bacterium]MDE3173728.1 diadenylate cyclase CdaA [Gemmatimonadota bacterium]MDE3217609.1 diadenylate cyclase CdaA [Gemmatimonadota bacterium]
MSLLEEFRLLHPGWRDVIEIVIVAVVVYRVLVQFQRTRGVQILFGVLLLFAAYAVAWVLKLGMIVELLQLVFSYGALAAVVVFQPELRAALAHLGRTPMARFLPRLETTTAADEIAGAVERLRQARLGAIIVVERKVPLDDYVDSGSAMRARVSADLLVTIFTPHSPLHDGAVVIRRDQIVGAACILPLTQHTLNDRSLGTRHRAALGLADETDAIVIVVSEETGQISVAAQGRLWRDVSARYVRDRLAGSARDDGLEAPLPEAAV